MENLNIDKLDKRMAELLPMLNPDQFTRLQRMIQKETAQAERNQNAIAMAVRHASFENVSRGQEIMENTTTIDGRTFMKAYSDCKFALVGLAFAAGIAEGKQQERNRRRYAAIKKRIRETGELPME